MEQSIVQLFPNSCREWWKDVEKYQPHIREIRIRVDQPILIYMDSREYFLSTEGQLTLDAGKCRVTKKTEVEQIFSHICNYSTYAYESEIRQGFLTVGGGHRIGICGEAVWEEEQGIRRVRTFRNVSCLNIRVSHEIIGAADRVIGPVTERNRVSNVIILSPPGCGKTTLLRDLIRQLSEGSPSRRGRTVGVVDERGELAGSFQGRMQHHLGIRTDVITGCPKELAIQMLVRSMAPEIIALDEFGTPGEFRAIQYAQTAGCRVIATAHGECAEEVADRMGIDWQSWNRVFELAVRLEKRAGRCLVTQILAESGGNA